MKKAGAIADRQLEFEAMRHAIDGVWGESGFEIEVDDIALAVGFQFVRAGLREALKWIGNAMKSDAQRELESKIRQELIRLKRQHTEYGVTVVFLWGGVLVLCWIEFQHFLG